MIGMCQVPRLTPHTLDTLKRICTSCAEALNVEDLTTPQLCCQERTKEGNSTTETLVQWTCIAASAQRRKGVGEAFGYSLGTVT